VAEDSELIAALKRLRKVYGEDVVSILVAEEELPCIPTGIPALNAIIGQPGLPRGKIVELYGREACGKSLLAASIAAACIREGLTVLWMDYENSLEPAFLETLGVQLGSNFLVTTPTSMEEGFAVALTLAKTRSIDLIVLDSVGALIPASTLTRDSGDQKPGEVSRVLSVCLSQTLPIIKESGTVLLCINHIRSQISSYGSGETTSGGNALKYYSHIKMRMTRRAILKGEEGAVGIESSVKVEKNKVGKPFRECSIKMFFDSGIDQVAVLFDELVRCKIVEIGTSGWVVGEEIGLKVRGRENAIAMLREDNDLMTRATNLVTGSAPFSPVEEGGFGDE